MTDHSDSKLIDLISKQCDYSKIKEFTITRIIHAKTILLQEGNIADTLFFIKRGCLRLYYYNEGKDITFQFFFEGAFVASFDSFYHNEPSLFSLESIENTEIIAIPKKVFFKLVDSSPELKNAVFDILADRFRIYQLLFLSRIRDTPQQRYKELLQKYPEILQRVPQHYIASYLGITSVSLSRIRNRKGI